MFNMEESVDVTRTKVQNWHAKILTNAEDGRLQSPPSANDDNLTASHDTSDTLIEVGHFYLGMFAKKEIGTILVLTSNMSKRFTPTILKR